MQQVLSMAVGANGLLVPRAVQTSLPCTAVVTYFRRRCAQAVLLLPISLVVSGFDGCQAVLLLLLQGAPLPRVDQAHAERVVAHIVLFIGKTNTRNEGERKHDTTV